MKFRVEHDVLAEAVAWVARALPSRPVVPVLSGLRLDAADGMLTLSCFDYELSATVRVEADIVEPGTALVPGRLLAEITRSLPGQPAEFAADGDVVNLTCGSAEFSLVSLPLSDYPALPPTPPLAGMIDGGELAAATAQVLPAASRDDTLPMLTAVCLDMSGGSMTLAATDRYRLAVREVQWEPARPGLRAIALVPARTLADAARTMMAGEQVAVAFTPGDEPPGPGGRARTGASASTGHPGHDEPRPVEGMISFESRGRRLTGRLIAGEFIRYASRFPDGYSCRAEVRGLVHRGRQAGVTGRGPGQPGAADVQPGPGRRRSADRGPRPGGGDRDRQLPGGRAGYRLQSAVPARRADGGGSGTVPARIPPISRTRGHARRRSGWSSPAPPSQPSSPGTRPDRGKPPAFRYLVVPLRSPTRA